MSTCAPLEKSLFDRENLDLYLDGDLTIFDYEIPNCLLFSQGEWRMVRRDLSLAGVSVDCIDALENGPCSEIMQAFKIRKELINYKKICLHLFEESKKNERDLKQAMHFFYYEDGAVKKIEGALSHLQAIIQCSPLDLEEDVSPMDLDPIQRAMERHGSITNPCEDIDRKVMYVVATDMISYNRGVSLAVHDSRNIAKQICLSPRHIDMERPKKLIELPTSLFIERLISRTESEMGIHESTVDENDEEVPHFSEKPGVASMNRILDEVKTKLDWPDEAIEFLRASIFARGAFKALAIIEELRNYNYHLQKLPGRFDRVLNRLREEHSNLISTSIEKNDFSMDSKLILPSEACARVNKLQQLRGIINVLKENARWILLLVNLADQNGNEEFQRIFRAGDEATKNNACLFVPREFELGNIVSSVRKVLDEVLLPTMHNTVSLESWPPTKGTSRVRIVAFDETRPEELEIVRKKVKPCSECKGLFGDLWIRHNVCVVCEILKRKNSNSSECIFSDCKYKTMAFCPHAQKCFSCDAPHTCDKLCRLSRGNGESAIGMVESIRPDFLLIDFDRTLASTKSGATPFPKNGTRHTIDTDLKSAVMIQHGMEGKSFIVTRNSHKDEIREFLIQHEMEELANNVLVCPKKMTKGRFICEQFFSDEQNRSCIFIDDDIRELCKDQWLRDNESIHRLLFVRGLC